MTRTPPWLRSVAPCTGWHRRAIDAVHRRTILIAERRGTSSPSCGPAKPRTTFAPQLADLLFQPSSLVPPFDTGPAAADFLSSPRDPDGAGERALVAGIQQGDLDAFRMLHGRFVVDLLDFAHSYLRSRYDAEEVVQDLFLWIWEHRHEWTAPGGLRSYLFKAVRNRAINRLRQARVQATYAERVGQRTRLPEESRAVPDDALAKVTAGELAAVLADAVGTLPPRCREVFILIRERGLTYAEVAGLLGISPKTVEIHMNHALGVLRRRVAEWRDR